MFNKLQLNSHAALHVAKGDLSNSAGLVLLKLMYQINRNNIIAGTPESISKIAGSNLHIFNRGLHALKQLDFIRKYTKKEYMLNPDVLFNGTDKQYYVVKHMWDTQTTKGIRAIPEERTKETKSSEC